MTYDLDFVNSSRSILDLASGLDTASGGLFSALFLLSLFIVTMIVSMSYYNDVKSSLLIASFSSSLVAIPLWAVGLIGYNIVVYPIVFLVGSFLIYYFAPSA